MADWDSMDRVKTQTRDRAFQTLGQAFDFLLRFQSSTECFESSGECLKNSAERLKGLAVCFKTSIRPSVSLKRVYENLVCKKNRIFIGV